jgi:small-conductance mechanosensitive channel
MRAKAQERILILLAALLIALMALKLTYAIVLTVTAVIQTLIIELVLLAGGYYGAKRFIFKRGE